jgi:hypothetical protein
MSSAMDAQARRERRQARIREGGANRLAKITKVSNPDGPDYKGEWENFVAMINPK